MIEAADDGGCCVEPCFAGSIGEGVGVDEVAFAAAGMAGSKDVDDSSGPSGEVVGVGGHPCPKR